MAATVATLSGAEATITDEGLDQLVSHIHGEVIDRPAAALSEARVAFNAMHDGAPA